MICKKCNKEVEYLNYAETKTIYGTYDPINEFEDYEDNGGDGHHIVFKTPCCDEEVADSESGAYKLLKE